MKSESLLDHKRMGGLNGSKGFRFETSYILTRIQQWLRSNVESFQQEGWSDVELFFTSGNRRLIQIKDHNLTRTELVGILNDFSLRNRAFDYEQFVIASAGLAPIVEKLSKQLRRYRDLVRHSETEREPVGERIVSTLKNLGIEQHKGLVLEKLFFDADLASIRDAEFCRNAFLGGMLSDYRVSVASGDQLFLRTAAMLAQRHGKLIRMSELRRSLVQAQLENLESSLSHFRLIRKEFLQSLQNHSSGTFFYSGAAPTWADLLNRLDIPRDITALIMPVLDEQQQEKAFLPIVAEAGEGKSTVLRRLAIELVNKNKPVLFLEGSSTVADFKEVQRVSRIVGERVFVFLDEAGRIQNLTNFLQSVSELPISVTIIGAARPYEMAAVRAAYSVNIYVALNADQTEYSIEGLSDGEIDELVRRLMDADILCLPPGVGASVAADAIKQRTDRKFLVLAIELTQGAKVQNIVRDEIQRIRAKGERLFSIYRYVCLMASIDSHITIDLIEDLAATNNVRLDAQTELKGLVTIAGDKLYPRHNRIGEIATEIFFEELDDERGNVLCRIINAAFRRQELDIIRSAVRISHDVPSSQVKKVVNLLIDEAYRFGEIKLIENVIEEFQWGHELTEQFLEFLTAKTPFLWDCLIFPSGPSLNWRQIEKTLNVSFDSIATNHLDARLDVVDESFEQGMKWAQLYSLAAWHWRDQTSFLVAITRHIYDVLRERYPDKEFEICFAHAEFLSDKWREVEAIELYKNALELQPQNAAAHAGIALAFYMAHDYALALNHYRIAMRSDPQSLFRVSNESLFEELTERLLELEEFVEYRKAKLKNDFRVGRGFQNMASRFPTMLVNLKGKPEDANAGLGHFNQMDYSKEEERRVLEELDSLLRYLPSTSADERRHLEKLVSDTFGDLRTDVAPRRSSNKKTTKKQTRKRVVFRKSS